MYIRKTLLFSFVGVGLVSAGLLAGLAFVKAREAVRVEIEHSLAIQAEGVSAEIDKMMFERLQNAAIWSKLDVMQDMAINDIDKRLSRFLSDLQSGYGDVYVDLSCVDGHGRVVSSSHASNLGAFMSDAGPSLETLVSDIPVRLVPPTARAAGGADMSVPLPASFRDGVLGRLRLTLDWRRVGDVLDRAGGAGRVLALIGRDGLIIAASKALPRVASATDKAPNHWLSSSRQVFMASGQPYFDSDVIVGSARSGDVAGSAGYGWTTLVIEPVDVAFEPIHRMAMIFALLFGLILLFTVLVASLVSRRIAAPIVALTAFARGYKRSQMMAEPPPHGSGEVRELSEAFVSMVHTIDRSQQQLIRASKLAVVGEMSAVIAHEVRTPLGILLSSSQMLQREPSISPEGRELLGFIESETDRLNGLVSAMLEVARPRVSSFVRVDVNQLVHHCVGLVTAQSEARGVGIFEHRDTTTPTIDADQEQITQVLLNVLMNALQMLQPGGRIDVTTADAGPSLRIDVADDGPGIEPGQRSKIFEAFFFRREGGIGLGLAIVQEIISAHGGQITAGESERGGALFRIFLPRRHESATSTTS